MGKSTAFRGELLKQRRVQIGLSQEDLSGVTGISPVQISRYENGTSEPSLKIVTMLADHLSVSVDYLLGREDKPDIEGTIVDLPSDEQKLLAAYRSGKLMNVLKLFAQKFPDTGS